MEHNAKKRFNIIDIIAVVLILAVLAFGAWKLLGSGGRRRRRGDRHGEGDLRGPVRGSAGGAV